jgi:LmbE family N-acetylglucosaminyl deacetylase
MACDVLYVSPHADDVAFSAAGLVAADVAAGSCVTVLTVFEAAPDAGPPSFSDRAVRRAEDEAFAAAFGVELEYAGFADAIVRRRRYRAPQRLFAPLPADEAPLVESVRRRLQAIVDGGCGRVMAPLGVGGHVDHQIAHLAAHGLAGVAVRYYEDTPYVLTPYQLPRRLARLGGEVAGERDPTLQRGSVRAELGAAAQAWLATPLLQDEVGPRMRKLAVATLLTPEWTSWPRRRRLGARRFEATLLESRELLDRKLSAIALYPTQWRLFYRTLDGWRDALGRYARAIGRPHAVERTWREITAAAP